jgi:ABC-type Fe3+/spermidine/putrescine transport system ATPase subunit
MDKTFDCVEMKRQGQQEVHDRLKGMTKAEQLEYWQQRYREMLKRKQQQRSESASAPAA